MFTFKTKSPLIFPKVEKVKDEAVRFFAQDLGKLLSEFMRSLVDDLRQVEKVEIRTALPAVGSNHVGKFYMVEGTGSGADILYIGIDTGSGGYAFKQVSLT